MSQTNTKNIMNSERIQERSLLVSFLVRFIYGSAFALIFGAHFINVYELGFNSRAIPLKVLASILLVVFTIPTLANIMIILRSFVNNDLRFYCIMAQVAIISLVLLSLD
jgi:hypothetical protein